MSIPFTCACGKTLKAKDEWAGKKIKCPGCGQPVRIPAGAGDPPSRAAKPGSKSAAGPPSGGPKTKTAKKAAPARKAASDDIDLLPADEPPRKPEPDPMTDGEMFTEEQASSLQATSKACPFCKKPIFEGDPLCINCGTDLKTGKKIEKKVERRPLGPFIKLGVIVIVLVVGGYFGWKKYKDLTKPPPPEPTAADDPSIPAREALRDGNLDDFKGFAKALAGLPPEKVMAVLQSECGRGESSQAGRDKGIMALALAAWYGFHCQENIDLMSQALQLNQDERVRQICLEGLYAAGTAPEKRYLPIPERFAGLKKEFDFLPKTEPSADALTKVIEKADGHPYLEIQMEGVRLAVISGQPEKMVRLIGMPMNFPDRKPEIFKAIQQIVAQTFETEEAMNLWWANEGQRTNPKQWVAARLDPANHPDDLRVAIRMLSHLTGEAIVKVTEKSTDDEVKQAAAAWKVWCEANADKIQAP
ncbi:MAG: hypothetical protein AAB434_05545 [Planctomycetota bacterium]